jgi:outer membrane protein assembly factor BamB
LADEVGRIFIPERGAVACRSADDGRLLWSANIAVSQAAAGGIHADVALFLDRGMLVAADPVSGTVAKIDPATGKVLWERVIPADQQTMAPIGSGGASLSGRRLLVYGTRTGIVDLDSGDLEWSFESWRVKKFPVKLLDTDTPPEDPNVGALASAGVASPALPYPGYSASPAYYRRGNRIYLVPQQYYPPQSGYGYASQTSPQQVPAFGDAEAAAAGGIPQVEFSLTGPAVHWANQVRQTPGCFGLLNGPMLLLGDPAGIRSIRLDLPFISHRFNATGELTGMAGRYACVSNGINLQILDMVRGSTRIATPGRQSSEDVQWVVDGPVIYFSADSGILCLRTTTGQRVFASQWPANAGAQKPPAPVKVVVPNSGMNADPFGGNAAPAVAAPGPMPPTIARVSQGVLYTLASPTRIVALQGAEIHGN